MSVWILSLVIVPLAVLGSVQRGQAFDVDDAFPKGGYVLSIEGGYGEQFDLGNATITGLNAFNAGVRLGWLPWGATGPGPLKGALELGLEPFYQRFVDPEEAFFAGLGVVARYHLLPLGRFVPHVEFGVAPGATDLNVREQRTDFVSCYSAALGPPTSSPSVLRSTPDTGCNTSRTREPTVRTRGSIPIRG